MTIQMTGATTASEKFSARLSIAARATPAASSSAVSRPTMRDTAIAAGGNAVLVERGCDIRHVPVETALCDEAAGDETRGNNPERQPQQLMLDHQSDCADDYYQDHDGNDASGAAFTFAGRIAIEPSVERVDQAADPCDRMADRASPKHPGSRNKARPAWR